MSYLLGDNWRDFFDVIICHARKPSFFGAQRRFGWILRKYKLRWFLI
jgi:hypothetical protein